MKPIARKELENYDLTHAYAGNGWTMVEDIDEEYCRLTYTPHAKLSGLGSRAFLAWKRKLTVTKMPIQILK